MPYTFDSRSIQRISNMVKRVEESPMPAEYTFEGNHWRGGGKSGETILHIVETWDDRPTASIDLLGHILYVREGTRKGFYHCYSTEGVWGPVYSWAGYPYSIDPVILSAKGGEGTPGTSNGAARADHVHRVGWGWNRK